MGENRIGKALTAALAEELELRDLRGVATAAARAFGLRLEELFDRSRETPRPRARGAFYQHLRDLGWSDSAIGRLCRVHRTSVSAAIASFEASREPFAPDDASDREERAARVGEVVP